MNYKNILNVLLSHTVLLGGMTSVAFSMDNKLVPYDAPEIGGSQGYVKLFNVTLKTIENGYQTKSGKSIFRESFQLEELKSEAKKYNHKDLLPSVTKNYPTVYKITDQDSFVAAQEMIKSGLSPCVSNAANAYERGGSVLSGGHTQEEELNTRSTLYEGLRPAFYPMSDEELIYSPKVTVFMEQTSYSFMDIPFKVSVISQAYIDLKGRKFLGLEEKSFDYKNITEEKIRAHLRLAAMKGHDSVVLAASGCGAFSNGKQGPVSEIVAQLLVKVIESEFQGVFKEVRVAILKGGIINQKFEEAFQKMKTNNMEESKKISLGKTWVSPPSIEWNRLETRVIPAQSDFKEEKGIITLKTDVLPGESYLLESLPLKNLQKKDKLKVSFRPQGKLEGISFAIRDIKNRRLFPQKGFSLQNNELIDFETEIPENAGDEISVVFFNWGPTNATDFTVQNFYVQKEEVVKPGALSFEWNRLKDRVIPAQCDFKEEKGIITLKTDVLPRESYLLESLPLKNLQKKDKVKVSFKPQGILEGISFAVRDIKNRRLFPERGILLQNNLPINFETEIPESAGDEISVVFFNWGRSNATDFKIKELIVEKNSKGPFVSYYLNSDKMSTPCGLTIDEIHNASWEFLDKNRNYSQFLFPLRDKSQYFPSTPLLVKDSEEEEQFRTSPHLQTKLKKSLSVMLNYFGLKHDQEFKTVEKAPHFNDRALVWLKQGNDNQICISRILRSLRTLGLNGPAQAFFNCLNEIYNEENNKDFSKISEKSFQFWRNAVTKKSLNLSIKN